MNRLRLERTYSTSSTVSFSFWPDPQVVHCPVDPSPLAVGFRQQGNLWTYEANYHQRPRVPGADVEVCFGGNISVSRLTLPGIQ